MPRVPEEYVGLWRRDSLVLADGTRDATTEVYWLQSHGLYVDLRIPKDRPDFRGYHQLDELPQSHLDWLKKQEGFAGRLSVNGHVCHWRRDLDYQPPGSFDDIGEAHFISESVLLETGVLVDYGEIWRKTVLNPAKPILAARTQPSDQGRLGFWVVVGDYFMYAIDRLHPFEKGDAAFDSMASRTDFDCEIGFGRVQGSIPWQIERCSLPFREGDSLFGGDQTAWETSDGFWIPPAGCVLEKVGRRWRIEEGAPAAQWFSPHADR